ncbi:MAG: hypothetical protein ACM3TR_11035 [Caulobacteraceae bacterium]
MPNASPIFFIGSIRIGIIEGASCVNFGNNLPIGFQSYKKQNQGFGSINGDNNEISKLFSALKDSNTIDMLNQPDSEDPPDWVKKMIASKQQDMKEKK